MNSSAEALRLRTELRAAIKAQSDAADRLDWPALQAEAISVQHIGRLLALVSSESPEGISKPKN